MIGDMPYFDITTGLGRVQKCQGKFSSTEMVRGGKQLVSSVV